MVLKMLYNWDDMHILALLSLKKPLQAAAQHFFRWSRADAEHDAASLNLHSLSVRFTFSHQTSGACVSTRPLPVCQTTGLEASMPTRQKPCSDCIYNIFIYKQIYGGEGGNRTKTRWFSRPNRYNLIMQVLGWARDRPNRRLTVLERLHKKSP